MSPGSEPQRQRKQSLQNSHTANKCFAFNTQVSRYVTENMEDKECSFCKAELCIRVLALLDF